MSTGSQRRRLTHGMIAAAAIFGVVAAASWITRPDDDPRAGSVVVRDARVRIGERAPTSYTVTYRVVNAGTAEPTTETLVVRRPFASRLGRARSVLGRASVGPASFFTAPGPPSGDLRPDAVLAEAIRDGYAREREVRRVAGRLCRVFRIGAGAAAASLPRLAASADAADVCVDEAGLVLEDVTYDGDDVALRRVAMSVSERPRIGDDTFEIAEPEGDPRQVGSVQQLRDDSRLPGGTFWELPKPPKGFEQRGRFAVVPAGQPGFNDPGARSSVMSFVSEVWTDGPDIFVIDQGATEGSTAFGDDTNARSVTDDDLGKGEVRYSLVASEVRFSTGGARFVRVRGTLPPSKLLKIARALEGVDEGPLLLKDDPR